MTRLIPSLILLLMVTGCDLFTPRAPEPPIAGSGTFLQPDTPQIVIQNMQAAIADLNAGNYRRSLSDDINILPSAGAVARDPVLATWTLAEEQRFVSTIMASASNPTKTRDNSLLFSNAQTIFEESTARYEAAYVLQLNHRRVDTPTTAQGQLMWEMTRGNDGLWRITRWADYEDGPSATWSDLRAAFAR
jgi:hypothetical protein